MTEQRKLIEYECLQCKQPFKARKPIEKKPRLYCTQACHQASRGIATTSPCGYCGEKVKRHPSKLKNSKSGYVFCDRKCKENAQRARSIPQILPPHYDQTPHPKYTYRKRALETYGEKCANEWCPLTKYGAEIPIKMLDVDHIDNDRTNNTTENLQVLCVWCHALKTRGYPIQPTNTIRPKRGRNPTTAGRKYIPEGQIQVLSSPPNFTNQLHNGRVAQSGPEQRAHIPKVGGSNPPPATKSSTFIHPSMRL